MSDPSERIAITVQGLTERFRVAADRPPTLKERLFRFRRASYRQFEALRDVSFTVRRGESVALVGHNGSGKSTLLKCLARILPADEGSVQVHGRIATLLELGAGFHPDLSGRENVYLNGAILGLTRAEIDAAFDSIVAFAGVEEFIDAPVRNYSSGMYVRLGFAIAVHVDPDVLLVDEVLSVGDAAFQERSLARMRSFHQRGRTVVLVSHDLSAVEALCERTIVLDHGRVVFDGETEEGLTVYRDLVAGGAVPDPMVDASADAAPGRNGDFRARITAVELVAGGHPVAGPVPSGERAVLRLTVTAEADVVSEGGWTVGLNVRRPDMHLYVYETQTAWRGQYVAPPPRGEQLEVAFDLELNLLAGDYLVDLLVANASSGAIHDRWQAAVAFRIASPEHEFGVARLDPRIAVRNPEGVWPVDSLPPPLEQGGPRHHAWRDEGQAPPGWQHRNGGWVHVGAGGEGSPAGAGGTPGAHHRDPGR